MLINSDFERHGFQLNGEPKENGNKWFTKYPQAKYDLVVSRLRKGVSKVELISNGKYHGSEAMWSPEQLRVFLLFHKVITDNKK